MSDTDPLKRGRAGGGGSGPRRRERVAMVDEGPRRRRPAIDFHQRNCFLYLKEIQTAYSALKPANQSELESKVSSIVAICSLADKMSDGQNYEALYHRFMTEIEASSVDLLPLLVGNQELARFCQQILANESKVLEATHQILTEESKDSRAPTRHSSKRKGDSTFGLVRGIDLTAGTSIPSIRRYDYQSGEAPTEIRMGTQAIVGMASAQIAGKFRLLTKANQVLHPEKPISHVYFNLLPDSRDGFAGKKTPETWASNALLELSEADNSVAVVTLPAVRGWMAKALTHDIGKTLNAAEAYEAMLRVSQAANGEQDFAVSASIKDKLTSGGLDYNQLVEAGLKASFGHFGIDLEAEPPQSISAAQRQAVWFHFTKFVVPNLILSTLEPTSFNMTCKDGIDRGGVASAYYNLLKAISEGNSLTPVELDRALTAPAKMVKGRAIVSHQQDRVWNAINCALEAGKYPEESYDWLREWRDSNIPSTRYLEALIFHHRGNADAEAVFKRLQDLNELGEISASTINQLAKAAERVIIKPSAENIAAQEQALILLEREVAKIEEPAVKDQSQGILAFLREWFVAIVTSSPAAAASAFVTDSGPPTVSVDTPLTSPGEEEAGSAAQQRATKAALREIRASIASKEEDEPRDKSRPSGP